MSNLDFWNKVEKTDPNHTKNANVRGNKITAIAPQRQIKNATEQFGMYGKSWGFKGISFDYSLTELTGIVIFHGVFFYPDAEFPITASISAYKDGARTKPDADFAKKVETDALTKALSKLGFNADVFMGLYDDHKYVQMMQEEFNKAEPKEYTNELFKSEKESITTAIRGGMMPVDVIKTIEEQGFTVSEAIRLEIESI